jgi:hypothetical protein
MKLTFQGWKMIPNPAETFIANPKSQWTRAFEMVRPTLCQLDIALKTGFCFLERPFLVAALRHSDSSRDKTTTSSQQWTAIVAIAWMIDVIRKHQTKPTNEKLFVSKFQVQVVSSSQELSPGKSDALEPRYAFGRPEYLTTS